jgi:hypothetical protein
MNYNIIKEFDGKHIVVYTSAGRSFTGILKFDLHTHTLTLTSTDTYDQNCYGPATIDGDHVSVIREWKGRSSAEDTDNCESKG